MTSKNEADAVAAMQREKERERRRLRDRERRQNMTQEQRERHLARRRRNYQLRRLRAQNSKALDSQPHCSNTISISGVDLKSITAPPAVFPALKLSPVTPKPAEGARNLQTFPRRLRLKDVRHLARRLQSDGQKNIGGATTITHGPTTKRLRLSHVKRLARAIKVTAR